MNLLQRAVITLLLSLLPLTAHASDLFRIQGVRVAITPTPEERQDPLQAGLKRAGEAAFVILQNRMLTAANRTAHGAALGAMAAEPLIETAVIRNATKRGNTHHIEAEITFRQASVIAALSQAGIPHSRAAYPPVLLLIRPVTGERPMPLFERDHPLVTTFLEAARREYGMLLEMPLGDLEDMTALTWQGASDNDPRFVAFKENRYPGRTLWMAQAHFEPLPWVGSEPRRFRAVGLLREAGSDNGVNGSVEMAVEDPGQAPNILLDALASQLMHQFMERFISQHSQSAAQGPGGIRLRVLHDSRLDLFSLFMTRLQAMPGVGGSRVASLLARETIVEVNYAEGAERLQEALLARGLRVEREEEGLSVRFNYGFKEGSAWNESPQAVPAPAPP